MYCLTMPVILAEYFSMLNSQNVRAREVSRGCSEELSSVLSRIFHVSDGACGGAGVAVLEVHPHSFPLCLGNKHFCPFREDLLSSSPSVQVHSPEERWVRDAEEVPFKTVAMSCFLWTSGQ